MKINEYIEITNEDNMEVMKRYPDNYFDLAIVDPPYGLGKRLVDGGSVSPLIKKQNKKVKLWDNNKPKPEYFTELFRVSKNQIIWGGNYFINDLKDARCYIVWDKTIHGNTYADCDLAWTSFDTPARIFSENIAITTSEGRIHPTQKSIRLYEWIMTKYAKENDKILDTHLGSGSIAIALDNINKIEKMNLTLTACELDEDYYNSATKRIIAKTNWISTF